jgi:tetratricopeptide (TPR) repeat protein
MNYGLCPIVACAACVLFASSPSVRADALSDCQWGASSAELVAEACSTLIREQEKPLAWMHFNLGLALKILGSLEESEGEYSRAIQLDPSYGAAYGNRGNVRLMRDNMEGALADYRMAVRLNRKDKTARDNLRSIEMALRKIGADKSGKGAGAEPLPDRVAPQSGARARR